MVVSDLTSFGTDIGENRLNWTRHNRFSQKQNELI